MRVLSLNFFEKYLNFGLFAKNFTLYVPAFRLGIFLRRVEGGFVSLNKKSKILVEFFQKIWTKQIEFLKIGNFYEPKIFKFSRAKNFQIFYVQQSDIPKSLEKYCSKKLIVYYVSHSNLILSSNPSGMTTCSVH